MQTQTTQATASAMPPPAAHPKAGVEATSAAAYAAIGAMQIKHLVDRIEDIVVAAWRNGIDDMSGKEIQARYEWIYNKRIDASSVAARVNALVAAGRLWRLPESRLCKVTGRDIHPVSPVARQTHLAT